MNFRTVQDVVAYVRGGHSPLNVLCRPRASIWISAAVWFLVSGQTSQDTVALNPHTLFDQPAAFERLACAAFLALERNAHEGHANFTWEDTPLTVELRVNRGIVDFLVKRNEPRKR